MKLNVVLLLGVASVLAACSTPMKSVDVPVEKDQMDYVVKERNPSPAPDWMRDFSKFKRENDGKGQTYYLGESGDVNDRVAGCDIAALTAKKKIAQQIAELITNKIASDKQGRLVIDPSDSQDPGLKRAYEETLAGKSVAYLSGVQEYGTYWEHRDYSKSSGHKRVFNCSVVVAISDKDMQAAIKRSSQKAESVIEDADAKAAVKEALKDVDKDFDKYQTQQTN